MTPEQEHQLQALDVEIQIAEKQLRVAAIKKQIAETELDILGLHQELHGGRRAAVFFTTNWRSSLP